MWYTSGGGCEAYNQKLRDEHQSLSSFKEASQSQMPLKVHELSDQIHKQPKGKPLRSPSSS